MRQDSLILKTQNKPLLGLPDTAPQITDLPTQIRMILAQSGLKEEKRDLTHLVNEISRIAGKTPPWSYKYLDNIIKGRWEGSARFRVAIQAFANRMDGAKGGIAGAYVVQVMVSDPNQLPSGVYIPSGAAVRKCKRPHCPVWFLRDNPGREYHEPGCRPGVWAREHPGEEW